MTARGYKIFAWAFLAGAGFALFENVADPIVVGLLLVSAIHMATRDILKAVSK